MAKIRFIDKKFNDVGKEMILKSNIIIEEFQKQGYRLTLRQLYYQHVARDWLENTQKNYDRLGDVVSDGRRAGLIDWDAIEDRTRNLKGIRTFSGPGEAIENTRLGYALDLWADQPYRPEFWVEKEAQVSVVARACNELRVDYFACKGYNSDSEEFRAGERFHSYVMKGQTPIVFYMGDHDPSGIDMVRDHQERLAMFAGTPIQVVRLALSMDQIERYKPPPNPAKTTDSRFEDYRRKYGDESWEMDALAPQAIANLITDAVGRIRDEKLWSEALAEEVEDKEFLKEVADEASDKEKPWHED